MLEVILILIEFQINLLLISSLYDKRMPIKGCHNDVTFNE